MAKVSALPDEAKASSIPIEVASARRGEFERLDPVGGFKHWSPEPSWSIQKLYLEELSGRFPDSLRLCFFRKVLTCGVTEVIEQCKQNADSMVLVSTLLLGICAAEMHSMSTVEDNISCYRWESKDEEEIEVMDNWCSSFAAIGSVVSLLATTWCIMILWRSCFNFHPPDGAAYFVYKYWHSIVMVPGFLISCVGVCLSAGFMRFLPNWSVVLIWPIGQMGLGLSLAWHYVKELRMRDLVDPAKPELGFSDSFLEQMGIPISDTGAQKDDISCN